MADWATNAALDFNWADLVAWAAGWDDCWSDKGSLTGRLEQMETIPEMVEFIDEVIPDPDRQSDQGQPVGIDYEPHGRFVAYWSVRPDDEVRPTELPVAYEWRQVPWVELDLRTGRITRHDPGGTVTEVVRESWES